MLKELVLKTRSVRRYLEHVSIPGAWLKEWVDLARQTPSAANLQPLKYMICNQRALNQQIFECLAWAGYLNDWAGPSAGKRPAAYIVILQDTAITLKELDCDHGIAAQTIMLAAAERDVGSCIIGSVKRDQLKRILQINDHLNIRLVIALGRPAEKVVLEAKDANGSIEYWRDNRDTHHVPKRALDEVLIGQWIE